MLKTIASSGAEQKASLLSKALEYGELGVDLLIENLNDPELIIRAKAYELLQDVESEKAKKAIAPGLLFNPGDKIYSVYQYNVWFNNYLKEWSDNYLVTYESLPIDYAAYERLVNVVNLNLIFEKCNRLNHYFLATPNHSASFSALN